MDHIAALVTCYILYDMKQVFWRYTHSPVKFDRVATKLRNTTDSGLGLLSIFLLTILFPATFEIGGVLLSPNRLFLILSVVPFLYFVLRDFNSRTMPIDMLILMHGVWMIFAMAVTHGLERIPFSVVSAVEVVGGYLAGRMLVRDATAYRFVFKFIAFAVVILLPFTIYENISGTLAIPDLLRKILPVDAPIRGSSAYGRLGLERVYSVFPHPILWGLFCSLALSNVYMLPLGKVHRFFAVVILLYSAFAALSSAPLLAIGLQFILFTWGRVTHERWKLFIAIVVVFYIAIDLASNRTPITILLSTLTFNEGSSWTRVFIFEFGFAALMDNPIFGVGFNDYPKPSWLTGSVDNFWLLVALRYGLVGFFLLAVPILLHLWKSANLQIQDKSFHALRIGHNIGLIVLIMVATTVHIWGTVIVFVMFYIGAGAWIYSEPEPLSHPQDGPASPNKRIYSRFPPSPKVEDVS